MRLGFTPATRGISPRLQSMAPRCARSTCGLPKPVRCSACRRNCWHDAGLPALPTTPGTPMVGDWTHERNDAIFAHYFAMLADDITGRPYSKAARPQPYAAFPMVRERPEVR